MDPDNVEEFTKAEVRRAVVLTLRDHRLFASECSLCGVHYECDCGSSEDYEEHFAEEVLKTLTKS